MISRSVWICFGLETGAPEGIFRNERDATWYHMTFSQHVSEPSPYQIIYEINQIIKEEENE